MTRDDRVNRRQFFRICLLSLGSCLPRFGRFDRKPKLDLEKFNTYTREMIVPQMLDSIYTQSPIFARLRGVPAESDEDYFDGSSLSISREAN